MRNVSDEAVEKIGTHILGSMIFLPENRAFYENMDTWYRQIDRQTGQR